MKTTTSTIAALTLDMLPALGEALDGGIFAGITTTKEGVHVAVVLLPSRGEDLNWQAAQEWAKDAGGELPSRPVAALLFANVKKHLLGGWHWTSESDGASWAWHCGFDYGAQYGSLRAAELSAVAVRQIPLSS
jgi:hypothetical protein